MRLKKIASFILLISMSLILYIGHVFNESIYTPYLILFALLFWFPFIIIPEKIINNWQKKSLKLFYIIFSTVYFIINLIYFTNLPKYTYHNASLLIRNELSKPGLEVELLDSDRYNGYFTVHQKHGLLTYNFYIIAFKTDNRDLVYHFDQYTGEYDRINNDLVQELPQ